MNTWEIVVQQCLAGGATGGMNTWHRTKIAIVLDAMKRIGKERMHIIEIHNQAMVEMPSITHYQTYSALRQMTGTSVQRCGKDWPSFWELCGDHVATR